MGKVLWKRAGIGLLGVAAVGGVVWMFISGPFSHEPVPRPRAGTIGNSLLENSIDPFSEPSFEPAASVPFFEEDNEVTPPIPVVTDLGPLRTSPTFAAALREAQEREELSPPVKAVTQEALRRRLVNPVPDGTCGYVALFAGLYEELKNPSSEQHRVFFDAEGYEKWLTIPMLNSSLLGVGSAFRIREELEALKQDMAVLSAAECLQRHHHAIVRVMRLILLKHTAEVSDAVSNILGDRQLVGYNSRWSPNQAKHYFSSQFASLFLTDFSSSPMWLTSADGACFAKIFDIQLWMISFDAVDGLIDGLQTRDVGRDVVYTDAGLLSRKPHPDPLAVKKAVILLNKSSHFLAAV